MKDKETIADELYYKISKYSDVQMYDHEGNDTSVIDTAVLFQINYGDVSNPKIITFNIFDPEEMEMIFSKNLTDGMDNHEKEKWYKFVDDMRDFATTRMMAWKVQDITKSRFDKNDFDFIRKNTNYSHRDATMESRMYGSRRSSYTEQANTRLIVRHTQPIEEEKHGARSRNIKAIYIENANKERFLVPRNHMPTARALARHVANEGSISDDIGSTIVEMHDEMKALSRFTRKVRNTDNMMEGADRIIEAAKSRYGKVKKTLESLQKQSGYSAFAETFERSELSEDGDFAALRSTLTRQIYNEEFDDVLPYLNRAIQEADEESFDKKSQTAMGTAPITDWLSSGEPLLLFTHADDEQLAVHRSTDTMQKVALVLSNIAQNITPGLPDELFAFALNVSDTINNGMEFYGAPQEKAAMKSDFNKKLKVAIELVKRYLDDIQQMERNTGYAEQVRMERGGKKDHTVEETDLDMFENWVNGLTENALKDELIDASDAIMQYAYELGNTHMDYDTFIQAAELLDASNFDELKDLFLGADTDVRDKMYELMLDAGPAISDMVEGWINEPIEEPEMDDEMAPEDEMDDIEAEPEVEESVEDIARLAGVEVVEHGEASYSDEAQEWAAKYPAYWKQMEQLMQADMGADAISAHAFEEFDNDMDEHDINDMVTAFCEQYGIDYDTEWDYDTGEDFERDEVYADDSMGWMESEVALEEDDDEYAKKVQDENKRKSDFLRDREDQPDYCPACGAHPCECDDEFGDYNTKGRMSKLPQDQMETAEDGVEHSDSNHPSLQDLQAVLDQLPEGTVEEVYDETYGEDSMIYVRTASPKHRKMLENGLEKRGFTVNRSYWPGSSTLEVQVAWFKGDKWDESVELEEDSFLGDIGKKLKAIWTGYGEDEEALYDQVKKVIYSIKTPDQVKSARKFLQLAKGKWGKAMGGEDSLSYLRMEYDNPKLFVNLDKLLDEIERRVSEEPKYSGDGVVGEDKVLNDMKKLAGL